MPNGLNYRIIEFWGYNRTNDMQRAISDVLFKAARRYRIFFILHFSCFYYGSRILENRRTEF